eukprot:CAMPEP_0119050436 /NCGR_PEP_ID=MMETSP1177-20130426/69893_1 /TAXON_ID=2985 /ORGANISM="Ochromonas sp, Strain CCMP1899" /LENGTH=101 /DNA_ID=CAMNT_0007028819 /DNA_START=101 /DNA_END=403 /DNA_ORIENTATION=-
MIKKIAIIFDILAVNVRLLVVPHDTDIHIHELSMDIPTPYSMRQWFDGSAEKRDFQTALKENTGSDFKDGDLLLIQDASTPLKILNENEKKSIVSFNSNKD